MGAPRNLYSHEVPKKSSSRAVRGEYRGHRPFVVPRFQALQFELFSNALVKELPP